MNVLKLCMVVLLTLTVCTVIKQWRADFLPLVRMAATVVIGVFLISAAKPLLSYLSLLGNSTSVSPYTKIIFQGLGIAVLSEACAGICRDSGEGGLASQVELAGKLELLLLCIPLIEEILLLVRTLLQMGG